MNLKKPVNSTGQAKQAEKKDVDVLAVPQNDGATLPSPESFAEVKEVQLATPDGGGSPA